MEEMTAEEAEEEAEEEGEEEEGDVPIIFILPTRSEMESVCLPNACIEADTPDEEEEEDEEEDDEPRLSLRRE